VDQVGEPGFCIFVLGFYVQDLLGGFGGVWLAGRPLSFISRVLEIVMVAVPATPANRPLPKSAATSPRLMKFSFWSVAMLCYS
jgi:hypothetical protein